MSRALCKLAGMLVIAEFSRCMPGTTGKCPVCNPKGKMPPTKAEIEKRYNTFSVSPDGYVTCDDCGFAILKSDYDRMISEPYPFIGEHI